MKRCLIDAVLDATLEGLEVEIRPAMVRGIMSALVVEVRHRDNERADRRVLSSTRCVQRDVLVTGYPEALVVEVDYAVTEVLKASSGKDRIAPDRSATEPLRLVSPTDSET